MGDPRKWLRFTRLIKTEIIFRTVSELNIFARFFSHGDSENSFLMRTDFLKSL